MIVTSRCECDTPTLQSTPMNPNEPIDLQDARFLPEVETSYGMIFAIGVLFLCLVFAVCRRTTESDDNAQGFQPDLSYPCTNSCQDYVDEECLKECYE